MKMSRYVPLSVIALTALLSGCVAYSPAPLSVSQLAAPTSSPSSPLPVDRIGLLRLALDRSPALAAARASLAAAQSGAKAARNLPPLTLTLTAEYSKQADAQRPWFYGGSVGVPLDIGARRTARVTTADLAVIKAGYAVGEAAWTVRQNLTQALADLTASRRQIAASQALIDQRNSYYALIEKRAAAGEDTRGLAIQAQLDASALLDTLLQAKAKEAQARADLARVLNVPIAAVDALADLPPADNAAADPQTLASMADRALYIRADVLNAVVDYDSAENDLRGAIAGQYPDINIAPGYTWERGVVKLPLAGTFTLPPLDGNRAVIHQAQSARTAAGKTLEDQVKTVQATIQQAGLTLQADRAVAVKVRGTDLPLAENLAQRTARLTAAGEGDQVDRLTSEIALSQARLGLLTAEQTTLNDRLKLEDALHQAFDPAENDLLRDATGAKEVTK